MNSLEGGGAERAAANLSRFLPEDCETVFLLNDDAKPAYPIRGTIRTLGMLPQKDKEDLRYQMRALTKRVRVLKKLKESGEFDAVMSVSDNANLANVLSGNRCRTITSVRCSLKAMVEHKPKYRWIGLPAMKRLYPKADVVVGVSKEICLELHQMAGVPKQKLAAVQNGLDLDNILSQAKEPLLPEEEQWTAGENILVCAGRLTHQKGQWHLIRSLAVLKEQGIPFRLLILGTGEEKDYLQKLVRDLKMEDSVAFCGFCGNPYRIFSRCTLAVMPSMYEGFSNVLPEFLACGLPVVSTDHRTGAREILDSGGKWYIHRTSGMEEVDCGLLVPVCDGFRYDAAAPLTPEERTMGEALARMLRDPERMGKCRTAAKKRAREMTIQRNAWKWERLLFPKDRQENG